MAGLTLSEARTLVASHLDDASNARWSTTEIDIALKMALAACLSDYTSAGGTRFDTEGGTADDLTSSTSDGTVSLSSLSPLLIKSVSIKAAGSHYWPIYPVAKEDKQREETTSYTVRLVYVPEFALPSNTAHPLVGAGATAANSWHAFDGWICARAALQLAIKDAELIAPLRELEQDLRRSVLLAPTIPTSRRFPRPPEWYTQYLRWSWDPSTKKIQLCRIVLW